MTDGTTIEWTEATWNPLRGCSRVSAGCEHCYAEGIAHRFSGPGQPYEGLTRTVNGHPAWTGKIRLVPELLDVPLRWRRPRRIFVNSMSDLFHEQVPDEYIARTFAVMSRAQQHTFQVLTKRPQRMLEFLSRVARSKGGWLTHDGTEPERAYDGTGIVLNSSAGWPLPNVWLGVSVEDQAAANERIPLLLKTPAAVRWISAEPLLGAISFEGRWVQHTDPRVHENELEQIDWVVAGGESGHGARPMHPAWARDLRDQCRAVSVPFFFKQWGAWAPFDFDHPQKKHFDLLLYPDGQTDIPDHRAPHEETGEIAIAWLGKTRAGRMLDGREWSEYPR